MLVVVDNGKLTVTADVLVVLPSFQALVASGAAAVQKMRRQKHLRSSDASRRGKLPASCGTLMSC